MTYAKDFSRIMRYVANMSELDVHNGVHGLGVPADFQGWSDTQAICEAVTAQKNNRRHRGFVAKIPPMEDMRTPVPYDLRYILQIVLTGHGRMERKERFYFAIPYPKGAKQDPQFPWPDTWDLSIPPSQTSEHP